MFLKGQVMESISIDSLDKADYQRELCNCVIVFERPSLKPYLHFIAVKTVLSDQEKSTETVIQ